MNWKGLAITPKLFTRRYLNIKIYIYNGGKEPDKQLQPGIDKILKCLNEKGFKTGTDLYWFKDKSAIHNEKARTARFWRPPLFLFKKYIQKS